MAAETGSMDPERVGPYSVLRVLGRGGMGSVYLALAPDSRAVAVKVIHPHIADDAGLRRLAREAAAMRRVRDRHVAELVDVDLSADPPYLVTQYVPGRTLTELVETAGPLTGEALDSLAAGLAGALTAIHAAGVVHRDLTPRNVLLSDGEPVVIDFGIVRVLDATRLTQGAPLGTYGYVAPEILNGQHSGPPVDVFAWGATVAFAATGRHCFAGRTEPEILRRILFDDPDLSGVPDPWLPRVRQALSKDPDHRPSAADLTTPDKPDEDLAAPTIAEPPARAAQTLVDVAPPAEEESPRTVRDPRREPPRAASHPTPTEGTPATPKAERRSPTDNAITVRAPAQARSDTESAEPATVRAPAPGTANNVGEAAPGPTPATEFDQTGTVRAPAPGTANNFAQARPDIEFDETATVRAPGPGALSDFAGAGAGGEFGEAGTVRGSGPGGSSAGAGVASGEVDPGARDATTVLPSAPGGGGRSSAGGGTRVLGADHRGGMPRSGVEGAGGGLGSAGSGWPAGAPGPARPVPAGQPVRVGPAVVLAAVTVVPFLLALTGLFTTVGAAALAIAGDAVVVGFLLAVYRARPDVKIARQAAGQRRELAGRAAAAETELGRLEAEHAGLADRHVADLKALDERTDRLKAEQAAETERIAQAAADRAEALDRRLHDFPGEQAALAAELARLQGEHLRRKLPRLEPGRVSGLAAYAVDQLRAAGIETAADFVGVEITPQQFGPRLISFRLASGGRVQVDGIGESLAKRLQAWRDQQYYKAKRSQPTKLSGGQADEARRKRAETLRVLEEERRQVEPRAAAETAALKERIAAAHAEIATGRRRAVLDLEKTRTDLERRIVIARSARDQAQAALARLYAQQPPTAEAEEADSLAGFLRFVLQGR